MKTMFTAQTAARSTKYATAVLEALQRLGHATNAQLIYEVQKEFPEVSATTIHRVTDRLKQRGLINCAPKSPDGSERYDITTEPHHHFMCTSCGSLCDFPDTEASKALIAQLKEMASECALAGSLTLSGACNSCAKEAANE